MSRARAIVSLLAAASAAHAFQGAVPQALKGSITGQVVNSRTGAPLKRATVRLAGAPDQGPGGGRAVLINQETDEQGRYSFANLDPGKYRLTAERTGFLRQSWGAHRFSGGSVPVVVGDGQAVKGIDFKLMPQGVITGVVLDEDGEPMAGAQVRAQRATLRNGRKQWLTVASGTASDIGEYRLPELKPGRYVVSAVPRPSPVSMAPAASGEPLPATPELAYSATWYPSTSDASTAVGVDVGEGGEVRNVDVRVVKARVYRVRGRVTGLPAGVASGGRGANVVVMLTPRGGMPPAGPLPTAVARGAEGAFEMRGVPAGQYAASARMQSGGQQYLAVAQVDVIGSHVDGLVLHLETGGDVAGSVKLVDAAPGTDVKNLQVALRPAVLTAQMLRARVDADLKFALKSVPPGRYVATVSGYPDTCYVQAVRYGGADIPDDGVEMTSGGQLEVVLSGAAARIDLVVMTADHKGAAGAPVVVLKDGVPESVRTADENGMLSLKGLKPARYRVIAWEDVDPEQLWDPDFLAKFEKQGKDVALDAGGHEAVQLTAIAAQ